MAANDFNLADELVAVKDRYSDLSSDLSVNPISEDLVLLVDLQAIRRSVKNLILTNSYEMPFANQWGGNLDSLLFSTLGPFLSSIQIQSQIENTLDEFEPRVENVQVEIDQVDDNTLRINISYSIVYSEETDNFDLLVKLTR